MLAASGIGAILSPPTLGAAAFIIAEFLNVSYLTVLLYAAIPSLLYYLGILLAIEADARRFDTEEVVVESPPFKRLLLRYGYHFSSLFAIVLLLAIGFSPFRSVLYATVLAFLLSFLDPAHRMTPVRVFEALAAGARAVLPVAATCAAAGIIVAVVTLTGLGLNLSGIIIDVAGGSLFLCALLAAIAVLLLGLAVPVTASFIIAAVIVSPALTKLGVEPLAAYMFIFYYAVLSEVSPPTALSAVAAAAITGGNAFRTMMLTWKYTLPAFLVPFAFVLTDNGEGLLLQGSVGTVLLAFAVSALAVAGLAVATGAWLLGPARLPERVLCGVAGSRAALPRAAVDPDRPRALRRRRRRPPRGAASGAERAAQRRGVARAARGHRLGDVALERDERRARPRAPARARRPPPGGARPRRRGGRATPGPARRSGRGAGWRARPRCRARPCAARRASATASRRRSARRAPRRGRPPGARSSRSSP